MNTPAFSISAFAIVLVGSAAALGDGISFTTSYYREMTDSSFGGEVLKIGYGGTCSGTVAKGDTWTISKNVLVGCCPNNNEPSYITVYGTANTEKNVYTSGLSRSGHLTVDGGTWNCGGLFYIGKALEGSLTVRNGGTVAVGGTFLVNFGSAVSVDETSILKIALDASGNFGEYGGISAYNDVKDTITLAAASNLSIDATKYSNASDIIILNDFITVGKGKNTLSSTTLAALEFNVGGNVFAANDSSSLNRYLSGIAVEGFEDYLKSFIVNEETQSVALRLSKIPEPSAFGLLAGTLALGFVASRRRRKV